MAAGHWLRVRALFYQRQAVEIGRLSSNLMPHKEICAKLLTVTIIVSADGFDWYLKSENENDVPEADPDDDILEEFDPKAYSIMHTIYLTIEDAKKYVYSFSTRRRVHGWRDITIRLWI